MGNSMPVWNQIGDDRWLLEPKAYGIRYLYYSSTNYLKNKLVIRIGLNHTTPTGRSGHDSASYPTVNGTHARAPALVFVHESMGSESMWSITQTHGPTLVRFSPFSRLLRDCTCAISEQPMVAPRFQPKWNKSGTDS